MYAAGQAHPLKKACAWVMEEVAEGRFKVAIDTEIVQEIMYRYGTLRQFDIAATIAEAVMDLVHVVYPIQPADVRTTIDLFRKYAPQGVTARDILHTAVMQNNDLTEIISTDNHFDLIEGINRLDPQLLFAQSRD
jgi:predicted nucleic acid-binding protein